jgi:hypothetical protein
MRIVYLTSWLAVVAAALVAVGAPSAGGSKAAAAAKCNPGATTVGGILWVQYCGPGRATVRFSGKTVRFASGRCVTRKGVKFLKLGRQATPANAKTKYWELTTRVGRDGLVRKDVFVEWWLGKKHYQVDTDTIRMRFKNKRSQGTFTGRLIVGGKGAVSGSYHCST